MKPLEPFDSNMLLLQKVMDLRSTKQSVIASNIANATTPGYARKVFEFEAELQQALATNPGKLETTHSKHIPFTPSTIRAVSGNVHEVKDNKGIGDGNSVSVDMEMIDLSKNQLLYETAAQLLKKKFTLFKYLISEGK
jgi:flagellar basal-body rod protein FlgB